MIGLRACRCQRTFKESIYRHVNVVFKEGMAPPRVILDSYVFCDSQCPECNGDGWIREEAVTQRQVEALMEDFRNKKAIIEQ